MNVEHIPLLHLQRDLHCLPRGMDRFRQYLRVMLNRQADDVELPPLVIMNPMGKDHVTAHLDALLTLDADTIAADAIADAVAELGELPGDFKSALVVADDTQGGWTNRYASEYTLRFQTGPHRKRFWITGILWSSEVLTERAVREAALTALYRTAYIQESGPARTLREMLMQEGYALSRAGCSWPLDADDLAYTREILRPYLEADDMRTAIECLFGDEAGHSLGFTPHGLSKWAGLALALHDARNGVLEARR